MRTGSASPTAPGRSRRSDSGAPPGYLGDGATDHRITGSPKGNNFVTIEGEGVRPPGGGTPDPAEPTNQNKVWTDLFVVQGRLARHHGVAAVRAIQTPATGGVSLAV